MQFMHFLKSAEQQAIINIWIPQILHIINERAYFKISINEGF